MKKSKMPAPRRAGTDAEARAAHRRLRATLDKAELDEESLRLVESLIDKLIDRSRFRRR